MIFFNLLILDWLLLTHNPQLLVGLERKKTRRVNFIPKFQCSWIVIELINIKASIFSSILWQAYRMPCEERKQSWQTRATCGRALSCCRIRLRCCTSGISLCDHTIWSGPVLFQHTDMGLQFTCTLQDFQQSSEKFVDYAYLLYYGSSEMTPVIWSLDAQTAVSNLLILDWLLLTHNFHSS